MLLVIYMQFSFTFTCQILCTASPVSLVNHQFEIGPRMDRAYEKHVNYLKFLNFSSLLVMDLFLIWGIVITI